MKELFDFAFSAINIITTSFLVFILIYWLTVVIGLLDLSFLDFDVDTGDVDVHVDLDVGADMDLHAGVDVHADMDMNGGVHADGHITVGWLNYILGFFNLGQIPFMLFLSFLALPMWVISVLSNYYLENSSFLISLALLIPNFAVSLFISKMLTQPFVNLFGKMGEEVTNKSLVGKVATVMLPVTETKFGQAEIQADGSPITVNVQTANNKTIPKGEKALVIEYNEEKNMFLVEPYEDV